MLKIYVAPTTLNYLFKDCYLFEKLYQTLDTVFNDDIKNPWGMFIVFVILDFKMTSYS